MAVGKIQSGKKGKEYSCRELYTPMFSRQQYLAQLTYGQSVGKVVVAQVGCVVGVEVDQIRAVAQDNGHHAVLYHLPELNVTQALETSPGDVPGVVVGRVAEGRGGLQTVLELDDENFESLATVEYLRHVDLRNIQYWHILDVLNE